MVSRIGFLILFVFAGALLASDSDLKKLKEADEVKIFAESGDYDMQGSEIHLRPGKNRISYGQVDMTAREMWFNQDTSDFRAKGDVVIRLEDGTSWAAPEISGNMETQALTFGPYGFDGQVWHSGGAGGSNSDKGVKHLDDAWISTCDVYPPHYRISASSIDHYPDNTFTARNVVLKFGRVPVFYLPYAWGTTDDLSGLLIKPGYSGKRGAYLRLGRIWKLEDDDYTQTYVDFMSRRGIALGHDTVLHGRNMETQLGLYGLLDSDPPETDDGFNRRFEETHDRYRLNWYGRYDLPEWGSTLRVNLDFMSDIDMLEDWFKHDYRDIQQSKSFVNWTTDRDWFSLSATFRPRVNDFYTVSETLPEIRLDLPRQAVGSTPFRYQGSNSLGYYSMKWRNFDRHRYELVTPELYDPELHDDPSDYSSFRADSMHFLYLPLQAGRYFEFIPRAGIRGTYYSRSSRRRITRNDLADMMEVDDSDYTYLDTPVAHYDRDGGDVFRLAYEVGAEWTSRLYSDWADMDLSWFGGQGLRHLVEPYVNYTFAPDPSHDCDHLYFFDEVDRLERQHFVRFGLDHQWQSKVDGAPMTIARWQNYIDLHFDRGEESGRHPGDFGTRLDVYPDRRFMSWVSLLHDLGEGDIQRGEMGFRYGEEEKLNMSLRYVYRNDHMSRSVASMGSTLADLTGESSYYKRHFETADTVALNVFCPIDSITSFEFEGEYDFDRSRLAEHKYILNRVLHCWTMSVGVGWENGDFEAMILFRLTAFPKVKIDLNL